MLLPFLNFFTALWICNLVNGIFVFLEGYLRRFLHIAPRNCLGEFFIISVVRFHLMLVLFFPYTNIFIFSTIQGFGGLEHSCRIVLIFFKFFCNFIYSFKFPFFQFFKISLRIWCLSFPRFFCSFLVLYAFLSIFSFFCFSAIRKESDG